MAIKAPARNGRRGQRNGDYGGSNRRKTSDSKTKNENQHLPGGNFQKRRKLSAPRKIGKNEKESATLRYRRENFRK